MIQTKPQSPALARALPFLVFIGLSLFQDSAGEAGRYWIYLAKAVVTAIIVFLVRGRIEELQVNFSFPAILVGIAVFGIWIGIDGYYPSTDEIYGGFICPLLQKLGWVKSCRGAAATPPWNPNVPFGSGSGLAIFFLAVRVTSASLLVPVIEEVFWRSLVYRFAANVPLTRETLGTFYRTAFIVTSVLFGIEHREWLAGILCGCIYQGLVIWKKRLGDAIVAHGITNLLLGIYVIWRGEWHFW